MNSTWVWGIIGIVLLGLEIATGTFYIVWFGVAALCTAAAVWLLPTMALSLQFVLFAALAVSSLAIWKLNYKKTETHARVGQAQGEEIGRVGTVINACGPNQTGLIRFTQGLMGAREWVTVSHQPIAAGTEARVVAVEGNALRIEST